MIRTLARIGAAAVGATLLAPAHAVNFEYGGAEFAWTTKVTAGAAWRMEGRDVGKIGKLNVPGQENLCSNRGGDIANYGTNDDDCISLFGDPGPNQRLVNARGGYFAALMDDGNLNFDNGDLVSAIFKINTQLGVTFGDWTVKLNYVGFYDDRIYNLDVTHQNTQYQPRHERFNDSTRTRSGLKGEFREAFILRNFEIGERAFSIAVGNQRVRWGEANLHLFNTLDTVNPLDAVLALQPGFNLNELAVPTGMVLFTADIIENLSAELIYQYDWDTTRVQPSGTFFSSADPAGIDTYRPVLSLGQFPEDPDNTFVPGQPFRTLSSSTRTAPVFENGTPAKDGGQYGIKINYYAENLNDGTEFGFYYLNYHSRVPYFSIIEAQATCLRANDALQVDGLYNPALALAGCGTFNPYIPGGPQGGAAPQFDPLPINTSTLLLDYPEDIHMFGISVNTTALGWSVSGEYSFRPNLPAQVLISDVFYAGYQQAFASGDVALSQQSLGQAAALAGISLGDLTPDQLAAIAQLPALPTVLGPILPGARTFIPDYLSVYRGRTPENDNEYQPGEYVKGYERLKVGQFVINALKLFPSTLGSDDVTLLAEFGFTHIVDMPKKGDLYFQGTLEHTHPSPGADCSGIDTTQFSCTDPKVVARINPHQQTSDFADDFAAGVRFLLQFKYSNLWNTGVTVKPTLLWFEDIYGTTIFPVQNYVEGNRWLIPGFQFEIGEAFNGTLLYQYYDGADNALQDRDNLSVSLTYNF